MTSTLGSRGEVARGPFGYYLTGPPLVTPAEKMRRRWPTEPARRRAPAPRPPFEGHRRALGE